MIRRILATVLLGMVAAAAPAQSPPPPADPYAEGRALVADIGRIVTPDGVQETFDAQLGGTRQVVNVRGSNRANPILLFVHGGPGAVEMPIAWTFQRPWEDYFTVVQWDQRGAGRSYPLNDPAKIAPTMTLERYRDDAIELIEMLTRRYGKRKVVLLGHSWGSAVGLAVAAKRPDLLHAYVGMGQLINFRENERVGMRLTLARARAAGNAEAVREIEALRPYPDGGTFDIAHADGWRKWAIRYGGLAAYREDANFYLRSPRLSPEYTSVDRKAWNDGAVFTVTTLFPRLAGIDFTGLRRLNVPVVMLLGRHDLATPSEIAAAWLSRLDAPAKRSVWFQHSAHLPMIEEPGRTLEALLRHVLPLTSGEKT